MSKPSGGHRSTKVGNYPAASVVFSITLSLFLLGLFGLLFINTQKLVSYIRDNMEVQLYLNSKVSAEERQRLLNDIMTLGYINTATEDSIRFISREDAAADLIAQTGEDFVSFLGENPLRDAISFKVAPSFQDSLGMATMEMELKNRPEVFEVSYIANVAQLLAKNRLKIAVVILSAAFLLTLIVSTLINNTIKLALYSQRFLIRSMQLVGATRGFIMKPFLAKAGWYGTLAGIIAGAMLATVLFIASREINALEAFKDLQTLGLLWAGLLLLGIIMAQLSTYRALRKYLRISLDELY
jgi:cell division transport system permease protein